MVPDLQSPRTWLIPSGTTKSHVAQLEKKWGGCAWFFPILLQGVHRSHNTCPLIPPPYPPPLFPPLSPRLAKPPQRWSEYTPRSCDLEILLLNRLIIYYQNFLGFARRPIPRGATTQPCFAMQTVTNWPKLTRTGTVGSSRRLFLWSFLNMLPFGQGIWKNDPKNALKLTRFALKWTVTRPKINIAPPKPPLCTRGDMVEIRRGGRAGIERWNLRPPSRTLNQVRSKQYHESTMVWRNLAPYHLLNFLFPLCHAHFDWKDKTKW